MQKEAASVAAIFSAATSLNIDGTPSSPESYIKTINDTIKNLDGGKCTAYTDKHKDDSGRIEEVKWTNQLKNIIASLKAFGKIEL